MACCFDECEGNSLRKQQNLTKTKKGKVISPGMSLASAFENKPWACVTNYRLNCLMESFAQFGNTSNWKDEKKGEAFLQIIWNI